jgi:hypothetical protein
MEIETRGNLIELVRQSHARLHPTKYRIPLQMLQLQA